MTWKKLVSPCVVKAALFPAAAVLSYDSFSEIAVSPSSYYQEDLKERKQLIKLQTNWNQ